MKKTALILLIIGPSILLFGCVNRPNEGFTLKPGVLRVGIEIGYPPMEYFAQDGVTPIGFSVSMAEALGEKMGLKIEFIDTAWTGILAGIDTDKYDCIISSLTITDERLERYNFSRPYIKTALVIAAKGETKVESPLDLAGLRVAYQEGTSSELYMRRLAEEGLNYDSYSYDKVIYCFDDLRFGRVDAVLTDLLVANYYLGQDEGIKIIQLGWEEEFGICMKKGNDALTEAINNALNELFEEGIMQKISNEFFGTDLVSAFNDTGTIAKIILWLPKLLKGAQVTIGLTVLAVSAGLALGLFLALGKISKNIIIKKISSAYIFFFRGTPLLMQLYFIYYALPKISPYLTINSPFLAAFIAFTLNCTAYCAEIIRAAIQSIDKGQFEAAKALGLSYSKTMRLVILPQSIKRLIPPAGNEFIMMLKDASLVSMIALTDITRAARGIESSTGSALVYIPAMILYLIITAVFSFIFNKLEKKYSVFE